MLQFYAVLANFELRHLHVSADIQADLTNKFRGEAAAATIGKHAIRFHPGYPTAQRGEVLTIPDFPLSEQFQEDVRDPGNCEDMDIEELDGRHVKAIVGASAENGGDVEIAVFKELSGARILDRSPWNFFLDGNSLTRIDRPGVAIPDKVHAIYRDGGLYFFSYETARRFVDLTGLYREAVEADIDKFMDEGPVVFSGSGNLHDVLDSWSRRRISLILASRVWDRVEVREIRDRAAQFEVTVELKSVGGAESIVLPDNRAALKELLKVLNQDFFYTILDNTPMYAGIKVPVDATV